MSAISQNPLKIMISGLSPAESSAFLRDLPLRKIGRAWLLPVLFLLATTVAVRAGDYTYITNSDNTLTITRYIGLDGDVVIPAVIEDRSVSRIGDSAFQYSFFLTSVTIPASVTIIGNRAFKSCVRLTHITIPASIISIGDEAFYYCISLTDVAIGTGVTSIGNNVFVGCFDLITITVDPGNSAYSSIDGVLFNKNQTMLIQYPADKVGTNYIIPASVTSIGDHAFHVALILKNVAIPNGVTNLGNYAFYGCIGLTNAVIPDSVTTIGNYAFSMYVWSANHLTSVTIGSGVISIGSNAFEFTSLTSVMIPDSVIRIGDQAFSSCYSLTAITVDAGNSAYSSVNGVLFNKNRTMLITYPAGKAGSYRVPDSITSIADSAFRNSGDLTGVTIPDSVTSIGDEAFKYCYYLTGVYFAGNVPSIGKYVFFGDDLATVYYLPGTTGWGWTFGGRPAMPWWDGPQISANGAREDVSLNRGEPVKITVAAAANNLAARPLDWWIIARAGSAWYYLNNTGQWLQYDGNFSNCRPVYQGGLFNLPATEVLNTTDLANGSYTFWFAVDYPMDGVLNLGGYILIDSVNVIVQ